MVIGRLRRAELPGARWPAGVLRAAWRTPLALARTRGSDGPRSRWTL